MWAYLPLKKLKDFSFKYILLIKWTFFSYSPFAFLVLTVVVNNFQITLEA